MTSWRWQNGDGDFDDTDHWTDGSPDDKGFPGPGDDALIDVGVTVTAGGQTVKVLNLDGGATVTGGLSADTIQGIGLSGILDGGVFTATTVGSVTFAGGTLNATTIIAGNLAGGHVIAGTLNNFDISGADVQTDSIAGFGGTISDGSLEMDALVLQKDMDLEIDGGTVTTDTFKVVGKSRSGGIDIGGGTMTVTNQASLVGDWGDIIVNQGATLDFQGGYKLTASGKSFEGKLSANGGEITAAGRVTVDMADSHDTGAGLQVFDGTMKFSGTLTLGQKREGDLDVQEFGKVAVNNLVAGDAKGASGDVDVEGSAFSSIDTVILGDSGRGSLSLQEGSAATLTELVLGAGASGDGSVRISGSSILHVKKTAIVGEKGSGSVDVNGGHFDAGGLIIAGTEEKAGGKGSVSVSNHAETSFNQLAIWKNGSLSIADHSTTIIDVATIQNNGSLSLSDHAIGVLGDVVIGKKGSMSVTGATMRVDGLKGEGTIAIGKAGHLILDQEDKSVDIIFAADSKGAKLDLSHADIMHATIKGFAEGDTVLIPGLDKHATLHVAAKGANTLVTITDHGKEITSLTFAGQYAKTSFDLSPTGELTTTGGRSTAKSDANEDSSTGTSGGDHRHRAADADMLDGGASHDSFVFDIKPGGANLDTISDFAPGIDHFHLDSAAFAAFGPGRLPAEAFVENTDGRAETDHAQIIYNKSNGDLLYDADGRGGAHAEHFATLAAHLHLTAADFIVI